MFNSLILIIFIHLFCRVEVHTPREVAAVAIAAVVEPRTKRQAIAERRALAAVEEAEEVGY